MIGWAKPGVKCVCIRDTPWIAAHTMATVTFGPVKDEVCTIDFVSSHPEHGVGVALAGYREPNGMRSVFPIRFFKPLVSEGDDVALFAHVLHRVEEPA